MPWTVPCPPGSSVSVMIEGEDHVGAVQAVPLDDTSDDCVIHFEDSPDPAIVKIDSLKGSNEDKPVTDPEDAPAQDAP